MFKVDFLVPGLTKLVGALEGTPLEAAIQLSLDETAKLLSDRTVVNTWIYFYNPTGQLAGSLYTTVEAPYARIIHVGVPYSRRREEGFSGHTDALGRYYAQDPGAHYMWNTLTESVDDDSIRAIWVTNLNAALARLGSNLRVH